MPHAIIPKNIQTKEEAILEDENYLHLLPSNEDIIDYVKYSILVCLQSKNGLLTTDKFGAEIDMEHLNFIYHVAATDIELVHSVMSCIRLYLVPKGDVLSEEKENYPDKHFRFRLDRTKLYGSYSTFYPINYSFMDKELILWLRKVFNSSLVECVSDETVLEEVIKNIFNHMLWYGKDEYNLSEHIKSFNNYKEFKSDLNKFLKEKGIKVNGGGAGPYIDTYSYSYDTNFKKIKVVIDMDRRYRESLGRECNYSLKLKHHSNNIDERITVYYLENEEFWKSAFKVLSKNTQSKKKGQTSLFDFL